MPFVLKVITGGLMLLIDLASSAPLNASEDDSPDNYYVVKVLGAEDGFAEGSVTDVAQTPEGYLWIGTLFGSVLRYDGTRFVSYSSASTPEFSLKWGVPRLMVDREGTLWISMYDGGLISWDKNGFHPAFTGINRPERLLWSAPGRIVFSCAGGNVLSGQKKDGEWRWKTGALAKLLAQNQPCADDKGRVWYLRNEQEIGIWDDGETKTWTLPSGINGHRIAVLTADARGNIWVGTDQALTEWQTDHFEAMTPTNGESILNVKRIVPSGNGLWVEANGRMRRCVGREWLVESEGWNQELGKINTLRFLHGDAKGGLWSGVSDFGLIQVQEDGTFHRLTTRDGLPSNTILFAYQDRDGNTWTGYERGGLVQVRRPLFRSIGKGEGLKEHLINTVCEDTRGAVWIGTHGGTIGQCENGVCTNLVLPGIASAQESIITADPQGRLWIGAQGAGLFMWETGRVTQIATPTDLQSSPSLLQQDYVRLMLPSRNGRLWVGTLGSIGSVMNGKFTREYVAQTTGDHATGLAEASDGTIWAGTLSGLLLRWDAKHFISIEPPERSSLGRIWALWPTPDGGLWAGTADGGLLHWRDGTFHRYTIKDGLPSNCIIQILGDAQGNLWLVTRSGIVRIDETALTRFNLGELDELPLSIYGQSDGLLTLSSAIMFQPNCWRGRDGTLYFAMANSVAAVTPGDAHINPLPPSVVLEDFRVDEKEVWPERIGAVLIASAATEASHPLSVPTIKVGPGAGDLEFRYTGLSLGSPSHVRFKFKLDGLENHWNEAGKEKKAVYRHVPPGKYVFHVLACNSDGIWSEDGTLLTVAVEPYFYQTTWFRCVAGLLTGAGAVLILWFMVRRRLEQLERQHELERERARIAQDLHDELGSGLTEIGLLGGLLLNPSMFSERKQVSLERIVRRCRNLVVALDEIVWAVNPRNDSINSLNGYLCRYAQGYLEATPIRCRLKMEVAKPDHPFNSEQRHNIFLAFKEALTNVVKHSQATEVRIEMSLEDGNRLHIRIEDNGHGLPFTVGEDADGLNNLRQRMARIGGQCEIGNRAGGGVAVHFNLPLTAGRK